MLPLNECPEHETAVVAVVQSEYRHESIHENMGDGVSPRQHDAIRVKIMHGNRYRNPYHRTPTSTILAIICILSRLQF